MNQNIPYSEYFTLAPGLIALDQELDSENCPVSYRKYLAANWLTERESNNNAIKQAKKIIFEKDYDIQALCSTWYNNVYGHVIFEPPASRFIALATPVPIAITLSPIDEEVTLPDVTLIQYELQKSLSKLLNDESLLIKGLRNFQKLPMIKWVWLAMSDYDISVMSFELSRPAYHLSLWHTFQTLEKLLKATLFSCGETEGSVRKYNHDIKKLINALANHDISFSNQGAQIALNIATLVGGPSIRYLDDSIEPSERLMLAKHSLEAHHLLLEFLAFEIEKIEKVLSDNKSNPHTKLTQSKSDRELREKVHLEHKRTCSHSAYSFPPYALPERTDITYQVQTTKIKK